LLSLPLHDALPISPTICAGRTDVPLSRPIPFPSSAGKSRAPWLFFRPGRGFFTFFLPFGREGPIYSCVKIWYNENRTICRKGGCPLLHVAIVEDDQETREQLEEFIRRYGDEHGLSFEIESFADGIQIVERDASRFDIILLDIEMPCMNGMEAAQKLRAADADVVLVFVTNMAQYAIRGYEVGALDF